MDSATAVSTALSAAQRIDKRPFFDQSAGFRSDFQQILESLPHIRMSHVPASDLQSWKRLVRRLQDHGGRVNDNEAKHLITTLAGVLAAYRPESDGEPDLVAVVRPPVLLFVSHAHDDIAIAEEFIDLLKAALPIEPHSIRATSIDGSRLPAGALTADTLRQDVLQSPAFIALITPRSLTSTWVLFEMGARWASGRRLLPLLARMGPKPELPGPMGLVSALSADSVPQLHQIVADVGDILGLKLREPASYAKHLATVARLSSRDND